MMKWIIDSWYIVVGAIAFITLGGYFVFKFLKLPTKEQIANIKQWLIYACIEAEKALGSQTGQLKLRMVYDMFIKQFSWIAKIISFETFSMWVDEALETVRTMLETNKNISNYVGK